MKYYLKQNKGTCFSFLQQPQIVNHSASNKRNRFKRSVRLRISESSMNLSLEGVGSYSPSASEDQAGSERLQRDGASQQRKLHPGAGVLRRTPAVSPGSAEEEDVVSVSVVQVQQFLLEITYVLVFSRDLNNLFLDSVTSVRTRCVQMRSLRSSSSRLAQWMPRIWASR